MPAGSHRFQVGTLWCTVLSDGYVANPASWYFPDADRIELAEALDGCRWDGEHVISPYTCLLIETGREIVLADAGFGNRSSTSGAILARLELAGVRPEDVNTVVFTHAHPDHVGGAVDWRNPRAPLPMFPNARYVMAEAEWDFWKSARVDLRGLRVEEPAKSAMEFTARRSLEALRHQVELIDRETEIVPGVRALPAPGHTPGHLALLLSSDGCQLLNLGDAAVHPLHLEHPAWKNGFDLDPDLALATRRRLLERAAAEQMHVMAFHFPFPSVGRIAAGSKTGSRASGGWDWTPGW
jgi:glyoxylase-like metal-dependent hydrolase (beta-lactamase superfamily II)